MQITKIGHCCLLIQINGKKFLTDPGAYSTAQNLLIGIDIILITHEHPDHFHLDSLREIKKNNPKATVVTNSSVQKLIMDAGLGFEYKIIEHDQFEKIEGVLIQGFGSEHADIYPTVPKVLNTGYFIGEELFYPGDAFYIPNVKVKILALPVCGPWMLLSQSIDFALKIKPELVFPVHDGFLKIPGPFHALAKKVLKENSIEFKSALEGVIL